ncbi:ATP-binding protein [Fusobacterium nucleatum]|uniref:ATP-binding protein n=1 Tax=Fusobacterium animalis TaxID=76859 RepID=UPI001C6E8DB1|nr:ATP-binding protein [Fusobacterium animalis]QYR63328.1 ATP-binding protein [Fusobacterium animalis]QYR68777.1 ATP-binding protein [Fusobacterium animalis]
MLKKETELKNRNSYLEKLIKFKDTNFIKIITGIRRCGKSSLMKLMIRYLLENNVKEEQIIQINFESIEFKKMTVEILYNYVKNNLPKDKKAYLFFDEIQKISEWQDAINSFRVDFECDIYITGSNAFLLSSEYATYLAGRSIEIKVYPLSFTEFIDFHGYKIIEKKNLVGGITRKVENENGETYEIKELLEAYMTFGGMPSLTEVDLEIDKALTILDGIYSSVVIRDILEREKQKGRRQVTDSSLLRKIIMFLADNIGNNTSINSISNILLSEKLIDTKPAVQTVQSYVSTLLEAYIFYEIKRFDIKGKEYLKTLGKYYIVDIGLRNYLLGFRNRDIGHIIENIVYFELLRRGYDVAIGKIGENEIDFIATNINTKIYIQVTENMANSNTRERELAPFYKIKDNFEKIGITNDESYLGIQDGIKIIRLVDFLLDKKILKN